MDLIVYLLLPLLFVFLFAYASLSKEYKIINLNQTELTLTKAPFHIKTHVYMRDPLANMPWVDSKGNRPKDYLLTVAIFVYKDKNRYNLYTLDNKLIKKSGYIPSNFTGIAEIHIIGNIVFPIKQWFSNGKMHRIDGPAFITNNDLECASWYFNGQYCTKEQHKLLVDIMKLKRLI